ncbi:MAG: hydantoinase/oxoprolinase family protein [Pseudomonadota bacterium]
MSNPQIKIGVDIGGTFTDVVLEAEGRQESTKILTTNSAPEEAILEGLSEVCEKAGVSPGDIDLVIHGTTLATNALIERRGARTALITTKGFRDVIEMRTEGRFEQYDLNLKLPDPLISREHRLVLSERLAADGQVLLPLDEGELAAMVDTVRAGGYESVAVGFLHSYQNPAHEERVREVLSAALPDLTISLSSEVSPQMREYERFNTVAANAYVKPVMKAYLSRLVARLAGIGATAPVFLMHSGGGIVSIETAAEFPVRLVESGPAGGAIFAAHIARQHKLDKVISFDMGGTTAKICLIKDYTPKTARVFEVARSYRFKKGSGMPISIPVIDMVEIGAGGGSLAHVDSMNQIRVGPESAGSDPGPACYGRGGSRPAVTDADVVLGRIDPENFAGGSIRLSAQASQAALTTEIGAKLAHDVTTSAYGVSEVVDENMANAARVHAVENGEDLSGYTMIAFGGAAPLHAARLCQKLGIGKLLIPAGAGVGSAIGFLRAPFSYEATHSSYMRLSAFSPAEAGKILDRLKQETTSFVEGCAPSSPLNYRIRTFMRYVGQGWEIPVDLEDVAPEVDDIRARFEAAYSGLFGRIVDGLDIEVASWSVLAETSAQISQDAAGMAKSVGAVRASGTRELFDPANGVFVDAAVHERDGMQPGVIEAGPAIVVERETATIIPPGFSAQLHDDGTLVLEQGASS